IDAQPRQAGAGSDLVSAAERVSHIAQLKPDICTVDCGTMNEGDDLVYIATKSILREMLSIVCSQGVVPELEVFDLGQIQLVSSLVSEGAVSGSSLVQCCLGIGTNAPADLRVLSLFQSLLPEGARWAAFGIGPDEFPMVAAT